MKTWRKRQKRSFQKKNIYNYGTGGGPEKKIKIDDIDNKIQKFLDIARVQGHSTEFGGDAISSG